MNRLLVLAMLFLLSACGAIDAQMRQQSYSCSASGGVLTASGCVGGSASGFAPDAPTPKLKCSSKSRTSTIGDTTTTQTDTDCHN